MAIGCATALIGFTVGGNRAGGPLKGRHSVTATNYGDMFWSVFAIVLIMLLMVIMTRGK